MPIILQRHIQTPSDRVLRVMAWIGRQSGVARITYRVPCDIDDLRIPAPEPARRADELWRHTCFELFVRAGDEAAYYEFNFSPSGAWAAYGFSGYRAGMTLVDVPPPVAKSTVRATRLEMSVLVTIPDRETASWQVGLSAVIEEKGGNRSYWALAHPPGAPDFHHRDCFALDLPPAPLA